MTVMGDTIDRERRRFLMTTGMTMAALPFGLFGSAEAAEPRELAAIGRAADWINSPPLTPSAPGRRSTCRN